ncbi:MAG: phosphoenolpyruvate carboxykinase (ATP) [Cyanobacteria bacterium P01_F01_bin.116]
MGTLDQAISPPTTGASYRANEQQVNTVTDLLLIRELAGLGLKNIRNAYLNLSVPALVEHAIAKHEGHLADNGALVVKTGKYTGRSPLDRFIVDEANSHEAVDWNQQNQPISKAHFQQLFNKVKAYVQGRDFYVFKGYVGADPSYRMGVRIINERASQNLFAHQLFRQPADLAHHQTDITVIAVPGLMGDGECDRIHSEAFIILHLAKKLVLIGGSSYAGEIKKAVFSLMNYWMPEYNVLPMHGAANLDTQGNTALFFGLSGTGKTTLSADPKFRLIGDDEHGWSPSGIFNFEGGCYAKTIRLSQTDEPQIWSALRFGALLENVGMDPQSRQLDYNDAHLTENTRAAYPLNYIPNAVVSSQGNHPSTILFLTADAFGVLPPIAKLTREQAIYHFLSGYTSKLAGTERGVTTPQVTFSACFGQCFFPRSPVIYGEMLGKRLLEHPETQVYWVNTGWTGGPYGIGKRMEISYTRTLVAAALTGILKTVSYSPHPIFQVLVPDSVLGIPTHILNPKNTWSNPTDYDQQALTLAQQFIENFQQFNTVAPEIIAAGPTLNPTGNPRPC